MFGLIQRWRHAPWWTGVLLLVASGALVVAMGRASGAPDGTELLERGERHWDGWIELTPAILTPRTHAGLDHTRVFLRLPAQGKITLTGADRTTLQVPAGTTIDRVEYRRLRGVWRAIDVRGTTFLPGRRELFRAYRAHSPGRHGQLFGVRWERDDAHAAEGAKGAMNAAMTRGLGFPPEGAAHEARHARYLRLLRCADCHGHNTAERATGIDGWPRRPTDASGLYSLLATLANESIAETYRPRDVNVQRSYVQHLCGDGSRPRRTDGFPRCSDGSVARARLDVARSVAAGDPATQRLCRSRRAIAPLLSDAALRGYAAELADCGVAAASAPEPMRVGRLHGPAKLVPKGE